MKLSEKWIRLSNKNKQEDKLRQKIKDIETKNAKKEKELMPQKKTLDKIEREACMLRKANESLEQNQQSHVKKIQAIQT